MTTLNPILLGKLFNFAGHPGTPATEAAIAARKAYSHCSAMGVSLEADISIVSLESLDKLIKLPKKQLLSQNADLQIALDDAQAQIVAQADVIADLRRSEEINVSTNVALKAGREVDASTIAALEAQIASLNETVARQQDALAATSAVATNPVVEPATTVIEEPVVEKNVRRRVAAKRMTSTGVRRSARMMVELDESNADPSVSERPLPDASTATRPWSRAQWARFVVLAALGRATSSIARTLSREFGRIITSACVGEMRRERWLSPGYGLA